MKITKKMLEDSYIMSGGEVSRLEWLSEYIFDFDTYETEYAELFAKNAINVCEAINNGSTFEFIKDLNNRMWFLIMCNMPFFKNKITWGTSIRGAFWDCNIVLTSCGLYDANQEQILRIDFNGDEWSDFVKSLIEFSRYE